MINGAHSPIEDLTWGILTQVRLPGGGKFGITKRDPRDRQRPNPPDLTGA